MNYTTLINMKKNKSDQLINKMYNHNSKKKRMISSPYGRKKICIPANPSTNFKISVNNRLVLPPIQIPNTKFLQEDRQYHSPQLSPRVAKISANISSSICPFK